MADIPDIPILAMPLGLPSDPANATAHYQLLAAELAAAVGADFAVRIWTDPAPQFSTLAAMVRSAVRVIPTGGQGPDGAPVATDTLILSVWLWDYLSLQRRGGGSGAEVPNMIRLGNVDLATVQSGVMAELNSHPRYAGWTAGERNQFAADLIAGNALMLVDAGTALGAGAVDASPSSPGSAGDRRVDLAFLKADATALDPQPHFETWGAIGGPLVAGHPLLDRVARKVKPVGAPLEGGNRARIRGQGFTAATTVDVGGSPATNLVASVDGTTLYLDVPPGPAGQVDIVVDTPPNTTLTIHPGIKYTSAVIEVADAVLQSLTVSLEELIAEATDRQQAGTLNAAEKDVIFGKMDVVLRRPSTVIANLAVSKNYPSASPELLAVAENYIASHEGMIGTLRTLLA